MHFVPHSHLDAGWLNTYDQYYEFSVRTIFESVFTKLEKDPSFTYTVGDLAYFRRYYNDQNDDSKQKIKALVKSGQVEIVHGGMVSSDEACPDYADILRNFEQGHEFVMREFGVKPRIGW